MRNLSLKAIHWRSLPVAAAFLLVAGFCLGSTDIIAQETVDLPAPKVRGQYMKALKNRLSIKGFSRENLSDQRLSDLLWSAFGVTNENTGRRTAPSAFNAQEIDIYVLKADGVFCYEADRHCLRKVDRGDYRDLVAGQAYAKAAPVQLLYVADFEKASARYPASYADEMESWAMLHTGFIAQNVTMFCAVKNMCSVIRAFGNVDQLRTAMHLGSDQKILMSQAVGHSPMR